jgi:iron(III) transport system ATP-binding protein
MMMSQKKLPTEQPETQLIKQSPILRIEEISKHFPHNPMAAVANISFTLMEGELLGLLGPSGCGKTTLLRMIAGFEQPSSGTIELAGGLVNGVGCWLPPEKRNTGMVFQDYALFPHLTIADNIAFGLRCKQSHLTRKEIKERVSEVLVLVGLTGLEKRYPHELSGGQQQRIALARALAPQPALILLDEPLSNLDVQVRLRLRHEVRRILKQSGTSAIFVTHDQEEALAISDKIAVMRQGVLEQLGTPEQIYAQPASRFVAEFVTQANFLPAQRQDNLWETELGNFEISTPNIYGIHQGELMIREEDLRIQPDDTALVVVRDRQFLGREYRYCLQTASGHRLHARTHISTQLSIGTKVQVSVNFREVQFFPLSSEFQANQKTVSLSA